MSVAINDLFKYHAAQEMLHVDIHYSGIIKQISPHTFPIKGCVIKLI